MSTVISASLVKDLREKTGVGMMDCKKALEHANGDFEEAVKYLREKGLAAVSKKADRSTNEGRAFAAIQGETGVLLELNCETDFVATNDAFATLGDTLAQAILESSATTIEEASSIPVNGKTVAEVLSEGILKLGENITIKQFARLQAKQVVSYLHMNGKIGVLVGFSAPIDEALAKDIAMHTAAAAPLYLTSDQVPQEELEKEKEIVRNQALNEGKPEAIVDKVVAGRITKFYKDVCLVEQAFVKDQDKTISQLLGQNTQITGFLRYVLG
jgi:elongation factor Ts